MEWNGMEWNGMEWNGMEWNGMECINVIVFQFYYIYAKKMKSPVFHMLVTILDTRARLRLTYLFYSIRPDTTMIRYRVVSH